MKTKLFSPFTIKDVQLKNRIVMSPMFMHSADNSGNITDWHKIHYAARALGQAGLIFLEAASVSEDSTAGPGNLGIWSDEHIKGLTEMVDLIHSYGAKAGCQLSHVGRIGDAPGVQPIAPSAIPFSDATSMPREMTQTDIDKVVDLHKQAAKRAKAAGFDILEIHAAHGGLTNTFLSPLANHRTDAYGGNVENRYRFLKEIIYAVKAEWEGPLFVRISSSDYKDGGNTPESFIEYGQMMKNDGVDLIDCSSGGIAPVKVDAYPGYQVPAAALIRDEVDIPTAAVGMITTGSQAEDILQKEQADLIVIGRQFLKDPFWPRTAAAELGESISIPPQYGLYGSSWLEN